MEYSYQVLSLQTTDTDSLKDVVLKVIWDRVLKDGEYEARYPSQSNFKIEDVDPANFVDFASLTQQQVISWIEASVSESVDQGMKSILTNNIAEKKKNLKNSPLPWNNAQ